jgi:hypothetical protein
VETIDKIRNAYEKMTVLCELTGDNNFHLAINFQDLGRITASVECSKFAKFLTNDFKALEKTFGRDLYTKVDAQKIKALFAISEQHMWFSRKELIEFVEKY